MNLLPLYGVLQWGWAVFDVMVLYWLENVIIGLLNIVKMISWSVLHKGKISRFLTLFLAPFFAVHYGGFTFGHGSFVYALLADDAVKDVYGNDIIDGLFAFVLNNEHGLLWGAAGIFAGHLLSYLRHFIIGKEHEKTHPMLLMQEPYSRVVALHVAIIAGSGLVMVTGEQAWMLLALIVLKSLADAKMHIRKHTKPFQIDKRLLEKLNARL